MTIRVVKLNEVFLQLECNEIFAHELSDKLSFKPDGFQHMPAFKKSRGAWDGTMRLFSPHTKLLYYGHLGIMAKLAHELGEEVVLGPDVFTLGNTTRPDLERLLDAAKVPNRFERRDYQFEGTLEAINMRRLILQSPTASGKSFMIYMKLLYLLSQTGYNRKTALIVPRTALVEQMYSDFEEYGADVGSLCGRLYAKYKDPYPKQPVLITTWQSIVKQEPAYFHQFGAVIGDEAHGFKAKGLKHIMENMVNASFRVGLTGSVPQDKAGWMTVQGLFGPTYKVATTVELQKQGFLNEMNPIEIHMLKYPDADRKVKRQYQDEISFLIDNEARNNHLKETAITAEGNTLVLFSRVEKHGKPLYNSIKESTDRPVYFIAGGVKTDERERIRKLVKEHDNAILVASVRTFSTGSNVPNLDTLIIAAPTKSYITVVQMIGRVLRKSNKPTRIVDVVDDLSWDGEKNYVLTHAMERVKIYAQQDFKYTMKTINL